MFGESATNRIRCISVIWIAAGLLCSAVLANDQWTRIVPSADVELRDPRSISVSREGLIYIADTGHNRVIAVDTTGHLIAETGGFGSGHGQFQWPRIVVADQGNAVWVMDYGNRRIEKFTRLLEYQGTLEITVSGDETKRQPEALATSPQGDVFVFDRDGSRIIRYDPLFRPQAELGSGSGSQFVSNIAAMTFLLGKGLFWWTRNSKEIGRTDPLLNPLPPLRLEKSPIDLILADADTCLLYGTIHGIVRWCDLARCDTLISADEMTNVPIRQLKSLAIATNGDLYLLDGREKAIYRMRTGRE